MSMIDTSLFPYENFGVRLEVKAENRIAWFKDDYDLQKYLVRSKLDKRTLKIDYRDGKPVELNKKQQDNLQKRPRKTNNRSPGGSKRSTKKLDPTGTVSSVNKSKSKQK